MPHRTCTICGHQQREAIDLALRTNSCPLRALAVRHGVSKTSLLRHKSHIDGAAPRMDTTEIDAVDNEIRRIQRALRKAQRSRTRDLMVNLSRELRSWITLKAKVQGAMQPDKSAPETAVSPRDALQMAMAIIEAAASGDQRKQVCEWLNSLQERLRPAETSPAQESEPSENGDISGAQDVEHV